MSATAATIPNGIAEDELKKLNRSAEEEGDQEAAAENDKKSQGKEEDGSEEGAKRSAVNHACLLKYMSLFVLVLQNTSQVLVMRYATTRNSTENPPFLKTVAVFFNEVVKFVAALILFFVSTGDIYKSFSLLKHHFITNVLDTLKVGVPAFIYVIQNFLLYVAVENLDAGTYMVTYQLKILTTAMFTVLMLKRKLSLQQWIALLILIGGVAIVQISANQKSSPSANSDTNLTAFSNGTTINPTQQTAATPTPLKVVSHQGKFLDNNNEQSPLLGFVTIIVACFLSGFAGIYFEKILKASDVSVWLRNTQLAALSIPIGLIVIAVKDGTRVQDKGFMQGFDSVVWAVVLLQALGGLVVAVVIKYADNILKAFATSVSIVVATVASIFIFAIYPKLLFIAGAALVIGAVVLYGAFPYKKNKKRAFGRKKGEEEEANGGEELQIIVKKAVEKEAEEEEKDGGRDGQQK